MDKQNRFSKVVRFLAFCSFALGLAACEKPDPEAELNAAAASLSVGNVDDAALRLNYVVQLDPDNIRARQLRGDVALQLGDYTSAVAEFSRALELGADRDAIALKLIEARIGQGEIDAALELLTTSQEQLADTSLYWVLRAEALLGLNRLPEAERAIEKAQDVGDSGARGLTAQARIAFSNGNQAEAFQTLEMALARAPNDPRVRIAKAELLARTKRLTEAAAELERAADLYRDASLGPRETLSLLGLVQIHLARNDLGSAEVVAARLAEQAPQVQWTSYFQGLVKFRRGEYDEAAALIQPLVNAAPDTIQYRSLLGAIQLSRGNVGQAEQQFLRVLAVSPRDPAASKLLAETRLRQQRPDAALDALVAVQDTAAVDPQIGLLSGIATVLSGNAEQGLLYLEQAAALDPTNELLKLQLARAYLATGRSSEASVLLTGSFGDSDRAIEASLMRLFSASRDGDADAASDIADELAANHPNDPRVLTAIAIHYQISGDTERARESFNRAAELETETATARLFVAASLVQEGREQEAEQLLRETIELQPDNAEALAGLAQLLARRGMSDEAATLFSRAAEKTTSVIPRLALVQMRLREGNVSEAKQQLRLAATKAPDNPEVMALNGIIALAEGRTRDAVTELQRAEPLLPDRLGVSLSLARALTADGQPEVARETLLRVLEVAPQSFPARLALGDAELQSGNIEGALSVASDLKVSFPSQAGGYVLEGNAFFADRQYTAASNSLSTAFERRPAWSILARKIQALRLAGRSDEAMESNEAWLENNPDHVPALLMRAVMFQAAGRLQDALGGYKAVLSIEPNNFVALNNAAWLSDELGEADALLYAERAYDAAPENAAVLDTYGWILHSRGQTELAIQILTDAVKFAPNAPEIRYHLSEALVAGGQTSRAREILVALLAEETDFDNRADAERLLKTTRAKDL